MVGWISVDEREYINWFDETWVVTQYHDRNAGRAVQKKTGKKVKWAWQILENSQTVEFTFSHKLPEKIEDNIKYYLGHCRRSDLYNRVYVPAAELFETWAKNEKKPLSFYI